MSAPLSLFRSDRMWDNTGVMPLPAAKQTTVVGSGSLRVKLPAGAMTSNSSPGFRLDIAQDENLPFSTFLMAMAHESLLSPVHNEYDLRSSSPFSDFLMVIYCPALKEKRCFLSAGTSKVTSMLSFVRRSTLITLRLKKYLSDIQNEHLFAKIRKYPVYKTAYSKKQVRKYVIVFFYL